MADKSVFLYNQNDNPLRGVLIEDICGNCGAEQYNYTSAQPAGNMNLSHSPNLGDRVHTYCVHARGYGELLRIGRRTGWSGNIVWGDPIGELRLPNGAYYPPTDPLMIQVTAIPILERTPGTADFPWQAWETFRRADKAVLSWPTGMANATETERANELERRVNALKMAKTNLIQGFRGYGIKDPEQYYEDLYWMRPEPERTSRELVRRTFGDSCD